jgi:hypothetical protein
MDLLGVAAAYVLSASGHPDSLVFLTRWCWSSAISSFCVRPARPLLWPLYMCTVATSSSLLRLSCPSSMGAVEPGCRRAGTGVAERDCGGDEGAGVGSGVRGTMWSALRVADGVSSGSVVEDGGPTQRAVLEVENRERVLVLLAVDSVIAVRSAVGLPLLWCSDAGDY